MMLYLRSFTFPSQERESFNFHGARRQCYNTVYPFGVLCRFDPTVLTMDAVTILRGIIARRFSRSMSPCATRKCRAICRLKAGLSPRTTCLTTC